MPRLSAGRLVALVALLVVLSLDVALFPTVLPTVRSLISPRAATTPASTPRPEASATPTPSSAAVGTYWTCASNQDDSGGVTVNMSPPPGAVPSQVCDSTYNTTEPGQPRPPLPSGIELWRVPAGTFSPFVDCGVTVVNILDPYDVQAPPANWPGDHELLYDASWNQLRSRTC